MARTNSRKTDMNRAAIYARVSDKSQAEEDKTSISEQISDMEAYCEDKGMTIVARYQEVGRGWSKKRPEFQRMLSDARIVPALRSTHGSSASQGSCHGGQSMARSTLRHMQADRNPRPRN